MILALDYETGGLSPERHAPTNLGVAIMEGLEVVDAAEWVFGRMDNIEPKFKRRSYEIGALEISGTPWKAIKEGKHEREILQAFRKWVDRHKAAHAMIVSHNATFDQAFQSDWMFRCGDYDRNVNAYVVPRSPIGGPWACTMRMAQTLLDLPDYKLDTVCAHFGLARSGEFHGATEDCILAGKCYHHLSSIVVRIA